MKTQDSIIGIDPGQSGGIATLDNGLLESFPMPSTEGDIIGLLRQVAMKPSAVVYLEDLVKYAGHPQASSHAIVYGRNFGFVLGGLQMLGARVELVKPQTWQKHLGLGNSKGCKTRSAWKNKCKALAQRLFPQQRITLKTADALLILEYGLKQQAVVH